MRTALLATALWGACACAFAQQAEVVGHFKAVHGKVSVITAGVSEAARPGSPVAIGSLIVTDADSSAGIALKDNTLLALGQQSRLSIDEFRFAPARGALGLVATIARGTLDFVSGMIARLRPESVVVRTPTSTIGVRGTHFAVKVED